jgi:hypothetical protein
VDVKYGRPQPPFEDRTTPEQHARWAQHMADRPLSSREIADSVPFTWPEIAVITGALAAVFGCLWLILATLEAQRAAWAEENARHNPCDQLGERPECVSYSHYWRGQ